MLVVQGDKPRAAAPDGLQCQEVQVRILVAYATCHGSTAEIADRAARRLRGSFDAVDCLAVGDLDDLTRYEAVVLGSPIHDQEWLPQATEFLGRFRSVLDQVPVWLFSVGMTGALPRRVQGWAMQEEGQMEARLAALVRHRDHRLFSGVVRREHLTPGGRAKFRLMGGRYGDFRNWDAIDGWADSIVGALQPGREGRTSA